MTREQLDRYAKCKEQYARGYMALAVIQITGLVGLAFLCHALGIGGLTLGQCLACTSGGFVYWLLLEWAAATASRARPARPLSDFEVKPSKPWPTTKGRP